MKTAIEVAGLSIAAGGRPLVRDVSLTLPQGGLLVVLGETGSGKTLLAEAVMGTLAPELAVTGRICIDGIEVGRLDTGSRRALWGRRIAMLPQEPWSALDPTMPALGQIAEVHALVRGRPWRESRDRARTALRALGLAEADGRYPFQLSGGMAQRVAIAATHAGGAPVLLADEPTKGLDADRRDEVADLLLAEVESGTSVLVITHDIGLARRLGGEMIVMLDGEIVERGTTSAVLTAPRHDYTRLLLACDPASWPAPPASTAGPAVIAAHGLGKRLGGRTLFVGLDLTLGAGEILGVTGPSGCGKTSLGNLLLGLLAPDAGSVARPGDAARHRYQKIYQDPVAAFAPSVRLRIAIDDVVRRHGVAAGVAPALLDRLRIGAGLLDRRPDQVSGGELQRIALARALLVNPVFLFADEATSRLDPVTQKQVMDLLREIALERGLALLLVTHDRDLARGMAARRIAL
jgi:ABC-type glutathione transport system ATPase component